MNLFFATIAAGNPWPRSRPCSALEPVANLQLINKYAGPWTFPLARRRPTPSYCVLLKQPDKQKLATLWFVFFTRALCEMQPQREHVGVNKAVSRYRLPGPDRN